MGIQHTVYSGGKDYELQLPDYIRGGTFLTWRWTPDNLFCMPNFCTTSFVWYCIPQKIKQCSISQCLIYWPLSVSFMSLVFFCAGCTLRLSWVRIVYKKAVQGLRLISQKCTIPPHPALVLGQAVPLHSGTFQGWGLEHRKHQTIAGLWIIINDDIFFLFFPFLFFYTVFSQNCYQYMD